MATVTGKAAQLDGVTGALESDTLTLGQYRALAGNGSVEASAEAALAAEHRRAAVAEDTRFRSTNGTRAGSVAIVAACDWCHEPFTPKGRGGIPQRYCSPKCRDRAGSARKRARAAGVEVSSTAATVTVEATAGDDRSSAAIVAGRVPGFPPSPAADPVLDLVLGLLDHGAAVEVVTPTGWRLVGHPR